MEVEGIKEVANELRTNLYFPHIRCAVPHLEK